MRTKVKTVKTYGFRDERLVEKFAFFPKVIGDIEIWWEKYFVIEQMYMREDRDIVGKLQSRYLDWYEKKCFLSMSEVKTYLKKRYIRNKKSKQTWKDLIEGKYDNVENFTLTFGGDDE